MKKQIALFLLTSMAIPTVSIFAMDKKSQSQSQIGNLKNGNASSICINCGKNSSNKNNCIQCKDLCENCIKHKQKLEEKESDRNNLAAKGFFGITTSIVVAGIYYFCIKN